MIYKTLKYLPYSLRLPLFYRFFFKNASSRVHLFKDTPLSFSKNAIMDLCPEDCCHQSIAHTGVFELHLTKLFYQLARNGGNLVDVGANYGYYSLIWASLNSENHVTSIEPVPSNIKMLRHNIKKNNFSEQICVKPLCLGNKIGKMHFDNIDESQTTWGGLSFKQNNGHEINVTTLDDIWDFNRSIDLLKIDVEGAELLVLKGANNLLSLGNIKNIFFEQNLEREQALNIDANASFDYLKHHGFKINSLNNNKGPVSEYHAFLDKK